MLANINPSKVSSGAALHEIDVKVDIQDVRIGMYISSLDIPWNKTRFLFEGFLLTNEKQLEELQKHCKWVIVSRIKSKDGLFSKSETPKPVRELISSPSVSSGNSSLRDDDTDDVKHIRTSETKERYNILGHLSRTINDVATEMFSVLNVFSTNPLKENYNPDPQHKSERSIKLAIKEDIHKIAKAKTIRTEFKNDEEATDKIVNYVVSQSVHTEAKQAQAAQNGLINAATMALTSDLSNSELHETINIATDAISDVVDSVTRNPDAIQLITKIKSLDNDSYQHAIDVSLLMIAMGRELCLPKNTLVDLGLGGLLHDVGEIQMPDNGTTKRIKNITKFKIYKEHVDEGVKIAIKSNYSAIVRQIIENHHEYYDGSGYPKKRSKGQIGLYGNMAVIVDSYVSLTSGRCCDAPVPPNKALDIMYRQRGKLFHPELLDQFIQIVGLYPVGTMVQLSSGDIGIVIKQNKAWRLKPVVMIIMDKKKVKLPKPIHIDLMGVNISKKPLVISAELPIDSFNINVSEYI